MHFEGHKGVFKAFILPFGECRFTDGIPLFIEADKAFQPRFEGRLFYRHFARNQTPGFIQTHRIHRADGAATSRVCRRNRAANRKGYFDCSPGFKKFQMRHN